MYNSLRCYSFNSTYHIRVIVSTPLSFHVSSNKKHFFVSLRPFDVSLIEKNIFGPVLQNPFFLDNTKKKWLKTHVKKFFKLFNKRSWSNSKNIVIQHEGWNMAHRMSKKLIVKSYSINCFQFSKSDLKFVISDPKILLVGKFQIIWYNPKKTQYKGLKTKIRFWQKSWISTKTFQRIFTKKKNLKIIKNRRSKYKRNRNSWIPKGIGIVKHSLSTCGKKRGQMDTELFDQKRMLTGRYCHFFSYTEKIFS